MHADTHTMRVLRWDWAFVYRGGHTRENCEAAGRGNLLLVRSESHIIRGDRHGALPLAMTT